MARRGRGAELNALRQKKKDEKTGSTTKKSQSSVSSNKNGGGRTGGLTRQDVQQKVSRSAGYTSSGKAKQPAQTQRTNPYATTRNIVNRSNNSKAPERATRTSNRINSSNTRGREQAPIDRRQTFATAVEMREARENERLKRNPAPTAKKMLEEREKNKDSKFAETVKNTGSASKKGALDAASGHAQAALDTLSGLTSNEQRNYTWLRAAELSAGIDNKAETRKAAKGTLETSKQLDEERKKLNAEQEKRQEEFDKKTKNSSGLQKAIYGAAESGTGMATDLAIGRLTGTGQAGSLASMFSRTYGTTRGQAEKEGATENEDRLYAGLQALKEVGTELMFPGVGLAKGFVGKGGIKAGEKLANAFTKNMRGKAADVVYAGLRMLGGTAEENAEELAGWGLDPFIKDIAYGRNVRARAKESLMSDLPEITSREQAEALTARLNSDSYINELAAEFKANGLGDKEAKELATKMRDFYAAYYSGDTAKADEIGDDLAGDLTGVKKISKESFSTSELLETVASTTLLTATTGLPGTISTAQRGDQIKQGLKADGLKALAKEVMNSEDAEASERGKIAQAALESGKDITSTQAYDLEQGLYQQQEKDVKRQIALIDTASKQADENGYVAPYTIDEYGRITSMEKATRIAYNEAAESASKTLDHVDTKESLTDIDKTYGARAIAGFKTGAFTVDDANTIVADETIKDAFKAETGIDLKQYEVKNRDGSINIPKTNAATKDALFAMATDNLVKMAETETANWKDVTKGETLRQVTARMGAKGGVAAQLVLNDVDERDTMQYRTMTAVSDYVYQSALNLGVSWEDAKDSITSQFSTIPEEKLRTLYDAGLADRQAANDKVLGLQTKVGEAMSKNAGRVDPTKGNLFIETEETPGSSETEVFRGIAESLGIDIYIVDDLPIKDKDGKDTGRQANGQYVKGDIYINVNSTFEENLGFIFMHEVTHHLKQYAPEQYKALENLVREEWFKANPEEMLDRIARKIKTYEDAGQTLTEEEALEEIIADSTHEFLMDRNFAEQVSKKDPSLAKAVLSAIKNLLRKLRQIFSSGNYANSKTQMDAIFNELGIMEEAEKLWLDAYTEAAKNKAAVGLVEWQDKVFEETRNSVAEEDTARYSISENTPIEDLDMHNATVENDAGDMVAEFHDNGSVRFSISSFDEKGREIYQKYLDKMVADGELSQKEADDMMREMETIYKISKEFADSGRFAPFTAWSYANVVKDDKGKPVFSAIKKNSEYKMNIDFSTICKKRRTLDAVFREMIRRGMFELPELDLNKDESAALVVNINNLIREHGFEAACALCFVEARRYRQQQTAKTFTDMWNGLVESMYKNKDKIAYFNFGRDDEVKDVPNGIHTMDDSELDLSYIKKIANEKKDGKLKQTAEAKAARLILNNPEQRKLMRVGDMMASTGFENMHIENPELEKVYNSKKGTGGAKSSFGDVQYLNEIINSKAFDRQKAYDVSGVRIQSFSDYVPRMVFDYVQVIGDLAAKRLPAHAYTKEVLFALQFGLTGTKINLSLVPDVVADGIAPGLDADGNYIWNEEGTFPFDEAMKIQEAEGYKENCGTIAVGISDEQIMKMLADPKIQMVIPYHKSSLNPIVAAMTNVDRFTDYTNFQNTKDAEGKTVKKDFPWDRKLFALTHYTRGEKKGEMKPKDQWGDMQGLVKEYVEWCESKNYTPKFSQFLYQREGNKIDGEIVRDEEGNPVINPGYYKMLEDFALLDNEGNFKPQGDVKMNFPTEDSAFGSMKSLIEQGLSEDTELEAKRSEEIGGIVDEIQKMMDEGVLTEQSATSEKLAAKFSISPEMDAEYMSAVNSGYMDEAQRLVDEAAKRAGYTEHVYHGTYNFGTTRFIDDYGLFTTNRIGTAGQFAGGGNLRNIAGELDPDKASDKQLIEHINENSGWNIERIATEEDFENELKSLAPLSEDAIKKYNLPEEYTAKREAQRKAVNDMYERMKNGETFFHSEFNSIGSYAPNAHIATRDEVIDLAKAYVGGVDGRGVYALALKPENMITIKGGGAYYSNIKIPDELKEYADKETLERGLAATDQLVWMANKAGYSTIKFEDIVEGGDYGNAGRSDVIVSLNPSKNVKSLDPVTYAEDGSVIPLSERFDPNNDDIRYSLPTQDSDGNILTDGQMEYFKNSQARDEQGRLVPVYHTTRTGGFTIFDPMRSDDQRSLFFTNYRRMSESYSKGDGQRTADINPYEPSVKQIDSVYDLPEFTSDEAERDILNNVKNIIVNDRDGNVVAQGDDFVEVAAQILPLLEDAGYEDEAVIKDLENRTAGKAGAAWEVFNNAWEADLTYTMDVPNPVGTYTEYLNLVNPLIIDAHGEFWESVPYGGNETKIRNPYLYLQPEWGDTEEGDPLLYGYNLSLKWEQQDDAGEWAEKSIENNFNNPSPEPNDIEWYPRKEIEEYVKSNGLTVSAFAEMMSAAEEEPMDGSYKFESEDTEKEITLYGTTYNTRQIAEMAQNDGYDGVIIKNVVDYGDYGYGLAPADVYIAFSSNQVKDTRNENPSENPDIRYSIPPEDETMSDIAYEDSIDDSFEELAKYEMMLDESKFTDNMLSKPFDEERVSKFYSSLKAWEPRVYNDPVLEEDAVRVAKSKADFYNNLNAKWQDRWTTEGEVLKVSSVRTDIRNLVKGVMNNSDTSAQYKTEIVNKTLIDARIAFQLMKQDRTDVASALLYHSAQRMIENVEFIQDDMFKQYKDLRDYLRTTRISLGEEYWSDVDYDAFRKRNLNKIKLVKGDTNVDTIYQEMCDLWPEWFEEEEDMTPPDMLLQMEHVLESIQPYKEAYSSEAATELCYDIADELYEIIAGGQEVRSLADTYKAKFDAKTKEMKLNHQEALRKAREERDKGIKAERSKWKVKEEARKEKRLHDKYFESIAKSHKTLVDRLRTNTKDKHIPEQYKKDLAGLLAAFDFQTVRSKEREAKTYHRSKAAIKMSAIRTALRQIEASSELFHINDSITDIIDELLGENSAQPKARTIEGKTLDELSAEELKRIDNLMKALVHEFNTYESVRTGAKRQQAADIGHTQNNTSLEHAKIFGAGRDFRNLPGAVDKLINLDEMTAAYMFRRVDPEGTGIGLMWKQIRRSFDRYVRNQDQLNKWIEEIVGEYHQKGILWNKYGSGELTKWRSENYTQTFNLTNGSVGLTPAQMMSIYCLARRRQAKGHMVADGIVVAPVSFQAKITSDLKHKAQTNLPVKLTDADINQIVAALTPDQVKVADKLQQLMATKMADWGNEASMSVIGIKLFEEPDYFPIRSDKAGLTKDLDENQFVQAIRNFGFTKATQPNARNAIMVEDIFDVVAEHCNNMNLYNSYSEAMNDFMKVYNYKEEREEEGTYSVEQALAHAYSSKATTFIMTLMKDLNGNVSGSSSGIESFFNTSLANAKKASVFANFRVAAQQPTAIMRAFAEIDPKYIKGINLKDTAKGAIPFAKKEIMDEMFEHCPIALWKSWGYYDINMGKSIEDLMMNNGNWLEDKATDMYGALDNVTWTAIWQMVKAETKDKHPDLKEGSDEFFEMCNERMSEIVDLTQVVDSPLHRSHAMRKKDFFNKLTTSFMAEPTLTFNMFKDGMIRASEAWKQKDVKTAGKIFGRTISVFLLQAGTVAASAALIDALRNKNPNGDDDDDEGFLHLWWVNTIENFWDNVKPWNNIYVVKDIASLFEGWENRNLALQGWNYLATGWRQLMGDSYVKSKASWWENMVYGLGYIAGVPTKTMLTGMKNAAAWLGIDLETLDPITEKLDGVAKEPKQASSKSSSKGSETKAASTENEEGANAEAKAPGPSGKYIEGYDEEAEKIAESVADKTGEEREKATWKKVSEYIKEQEGASVEELVSQGELNVLEEYRDMYTGAGNTDAYFDEMILKYCKSEFKNTINYDQTKGGEWRQTMMRHFMTEHGMTDEDVSAMVYKSDTAKDLKVAMRIGDEGLIQESLTPLAAAGLTQEDLDKLWKNRNRVDLKKYKENGGRYADKLKSMGTFIWPTEGVITSHFGYRNSPTAGASSNHPAIDIGASQGTPVVAADGGVVIYAGNNGGYGNSVGIKHDNGMVTYYNHLYAWNVKVGDTVGQGQQIAQVGSTGISTGPHLDFKILDKDGKPVDPEKYLN